MVAAPQQVDNSLLAAALTYAARGWHVFPLHTPDKAGRCDCRDEACVSRGKHPWTPNGLKAATTHEGQIRAWWRRWPRANIGIACGASGLVVLDVDPRHGGEDSLVELVRRVAEEQGQRLLKPLMEQLVTTLTSVTGGGGWHYIYQAPVFDDRGAAIRNKHDLDKLAGLDVRGVGGYFVAPPSRHANDAHYLWQTGNTLSDDASGDKRTSAYLVPLSPAPLPAWLLKILLRPSPTAKRAPSAPSDAPLRVFPEGGKRRDPSVWLDRALALAREGSRNETGFWLACQLRDDGVSRTEAEGYQIAYALNVPQGHDAYTEAEALRSLAQAYSRVPREEARSQLSQAASRAAYAARPVVNTAPAAPHQEEAHEQEEQPQEPPARRYRLLTDEQVEQLPPPQWLIGGFLVADTLAVLYGEYGTYKSFLALDWALCVATDTPWQGQPVKPGRVVYIAGEGIGGMGKRLRAWKLAHGFQGSAAIHLLGEAPQLLRSDDVLALLEAISDLPEPPALIVIDTLARSLVGGDENSAQDMGQAIAAAEALRTATGATVALIHHKPKGTNGTRGSTALPGAVYTSVEILPDERDERVITVHCDKQKDWERFDDRRLRFEVKALDEEARETSGVLLPDDTPAAPRRPKLSPSARRLLGIIQASSGIFWSELKKRFAEDFGMSASSFDKALDLLEREQMIENTGGMWRVKEAE